MHTPYVQNLVSIYVTSAWKGMFDRKVQFYEGAVHTSMHGASMGTCARGRVSARNEQTPCTGFIQKYICTKTL